MPRLYAESCWKGHSAKGGNGRRVRETDGESRRGRQPGVSLLRKRAPNVPLENIVRRRGLVQLAASGDAAYMDGHLQLLLRDFSSLCREESMQEDDWQRLYQICLCAHQVADVPPPWAIRDYLVTKGCSLQKASFLSHQYQHLTTVLKLYDLHRGP